MTRARRLAALVLLGAMGVLALFLAAVTPPWEIPGGPGFLEGEARRGLRDNMRIGLWWASLGNLVLAGGLLATIRLWIRPAGARALSRVRPGTRAVALVLLAMTLALGLRVPLATKSLWWDEGWSLRRIVLGGFDIRPGAKEPGPFEPVPLRDVFFNYRKPTNHVLYSVAASATTRGWQALRGHPAHVFSELAFRTPALVAGLATIAFVSALLLRAGAPHAAVVAAFLLAIHPWHLRYGVDGRAYAFVMAGAAASLLCLLRFLESARFRDALALSACQVFLVWSFPYTAFVTAGTALAGLAAIATDRTRDALERTAQGARFVVAHALAVMVVLQVMAPNLTQISEWGYSNPPVSALRLAMAWAGLSSGTLLQSEPLADGFGHPSVVESPVRVLWVVAVAPALVGLGAWLGWRRGAAMRAVTLATPLALGIAIATNHLLAQQFHPRFLIFALPGVVAASAAAVAWLGHRIAGRVGRSRAFGAASLATLLLLGFAAAFAPQLWMLLERPYSPIRDGARWLVERSEPDAIVAGFGLGGWMPSLYEPRVRAIQTPRQLARLCAEARREARPLYVSLRYRRQNLQSEPEVVHWLESDALERVARFAGIEPRFHTEVYRWKGVTCPQSSPSSAD